MRDFMNIINETVQPIMEGAYADGWDCAKAGGSSGDNPHPSDSDEGKEWASGFADNGKQIEEAEEPEEVDECDDIKESKGFPLFKALAGLK